MAAPSCTSTGRKTLFTTLPQPITEVQDQYRMKRDKKIDIRWNVWELQQINEARGSQDFSEWVRNAAIEKALEENDHAGI